MDKLETRFLAAIITAAAIINRAPEVEPYEVAASVARVAAKDYRAANPEAGNE